MFKSFLLLALLAVAIHAKKIAKQGTDHQLDTVNSEDETEINRISSTLFTSTYNQAIRPVSINGTTEPTYVTLKLEDIRVLSVDETKGLFTFQAYYTQKWFDPRLNFTSTTVPYLPLQKFASLWYPNVFFYDGVEFSTYPSNTPSTIGHTRNAPRLARVYPTHGQVTYSTRITETIYCPAIYKKEAKEFLCPVKLGSYGYFESEVSLSFKDVGGVTKWTEGPSVVKPGFSFTKVVQGDGKCENVRLTNSKGHKFSCVHVDFTFTRN